MKAVVIGCGVSGLSSGIRLLEAGIPTEIWTREPALATTSRIAAAFWYPYKVYPEDLVLGWAQTTYNELTGLASDPATGVVVRESVELFSEPAADPWWCAAVPSFRHLTSEELPVGYQDAHFFYSPVAEMPIYLDYLTQRFTRLGGQIHLRPVDSLADVSKRHDVVVNCSGLGAQGLMDDREMVSIRGQVIRVNQVGIDRLTFDLTNPDGLAYIVPRSTDCVLGGTSEISDDLAPDEKTAAGILARCVKLEPRLAGAVVLEHQVGLRPGRPKIRVEIDESISDTILIHNYGHGGAGVALSWGCADELVRLVIDSGAA